MADSVNHVADISEELSQIDYAYKGEEIRDGIVSALEKINQNSGTARSLDGHGLSEFLTTEELDQIRPLDSEPRQNSTKAISSGDIYTHLSKMSNSINTVNNGKYSENDLSEPIKDKLEYLNETKRRIREAIRGKGVPVDSDLDTFRSYAEKISSIEMTANVEVSPLEISNNGEYEPVEGTGYNPITVNVTPSLTTKTVTKNGTYKAEDDHAEGYSEVTVSATEALTTKSLKSEDFPEEIDELYFKAEDEEGDYIGYSSVSIDLTDKVVEDEQIIDPEEVGEEYTFHASDKNAYGFSKFTFSIKSTREYFTVEFYDGNNLLYLDDAVPKNGSCVFGGEYPKKDGFVFAGWNPQPVNVTRDMKCLAQWEEDEEAVDATEDGGGGGGSSSIEKRSWKDIMADPGNVSVGDTKTIYWMPFSYGASGGTSEVIGFLGGKTTATCVRRGELGHASTWLMTIDLNNYIDFTHNSPPNNVGMAKDGSQLEPSSSMQTKAIHYSDTPYYGLLKEFAAAIKACTGPAYRDQQEIVFANMKKSTMYCESYEEGVNYNQGIDEKDDCGEIWLLSKKEAGRGGDESGEAYGLYPDRTILRSIKNRDVFKTNRDGDFNIEKAGTIYKTRVSIPIFGETDARYYYEIYVHPTYKAYVDARGDRTYDGDVTAINDNLVGIGNIPSLTVGFCLG